MASLAKHLFLAVVLTASAGLGACGGASGGGAASVGGGTTGSVTGGGVNPGGGTNNKFFLGPGSHDGVFQNMFVASTTAANVTGQSTTFAGSFENNPDFLAFTTGNVTTPATVTTQTLDGGYMPLAGVNQRVTNFNQIDPNGTQNTQIYLSKSAGMATLTDTYYGIYQLPQQGGGTGATIGALALGTTPTASLDISKIAPTTKTAQYAGSFVGMAGDQGAALANYKGVVGDVTINADFNANSISGQINNISTVAMNKLTSTVPNNPGEIKTANGANTGIVVSFAGTIGNDKLLFPTDATKFGTFNGFAGNSVLVTNGAQAIATTGKVAGQFYNTGTTYGTSVAGTLTATMASNPFTGSNTTGYLTGAFGAAKK